MDEDIAKFSQYLLVERNYSEYTDINYVHDLDLYGDYLNKKKINYLNIKYEDLNNFVKYLKVDLKLNPNSINRILSSLRTFYNFLIIKNKIKSNPFNIVKGQKKELVLPNYMKYSEVMAIIDVCDDSILGIRNRCLIELLFASGTRISELINIKISDIKFNNHEILVKGKGNKERIAYFNDSSYDALMNYINNSRNFLLGEKKSDYLFINHVGTHLTTRGFRDILDGLILKSSVKSKITPHTFRHTFATMLLNDGCDLKSVQELLGHVSLSTTSIYTHISNDRIKDIYLHTHPRSKQ